MMKLQGRHTSQLKTERSRSSVRCGVWHPPFRNGTMYLFCIGTTRAYLQNHILGVSEGHTAILRLVGVGYRATVENTATTVSPEFDGQQFVVLKVGYSHPIELPVPKGVKATVPQPTRILLEGVEKEVILQFAAKIRMWRKPEPYKGKGIFVNGETIKLKAKKIK
jgi:large subunit ribosomal protein L6